MKKTLALFFLILNALFASAEAADLMQVFHQAIACDPTFKAAEAQYLAVKENVPIARSALLPSLILSGFTQRQYIDPKLDASPFFREPNAFYNTENQYMLDLVQPIFNYSAWARLSTATYQAKQAEATFAASAQDLMIRTAQAYFAVLQASDNLRFTQAQKRAVAEQLRQTRQQYEVGLVPITGVKEAEANFDSLVAAEIAAKNSLANAVEQLRAITTKTYPTLMGASKLPLVTPIPADIDRWVDIAERQNYSLQAAINNSMAAEQNIKVQAGGHLPVINGTAGYMIDHNTNGGFNSFGTIGAAQTQSYEVGLNLNFPIYQGGLVNAQTRQARFQYENAVSTMEFTHRTVVQGTRNAYLGVITGVSKIAADRATVIANQIALTATRNGFDAGTRTMLDVLNSQTTLYQSQKNYSVDQYNYLINLLTLKQSAGTLSPSDLVQVNTWLLAEVSILPKIANIADYAEDIPGYQLETFKTKPYIKKNKITTVTKKSKMTALASSKTQRSKKIPLPEKIKPSTEKPKKVEVTTSTSKKSLIVKPVATPAHYYAIALFDTRYKSHADDFIREHGLTQQASYLTIKNAKGEMRYQVIYGNYKTLQEAEAAMKKLPQSLQTLNPWIKVIQQTNVSTGNQKTS